MIKRVGDAVRVRFEMDVTTARKFAGQIQDKAREVTRTGGNRCAGMTDADGNGFELVIHQWPRARKEK